MGKNDEQVFHRAGTINCNKHMKRCTTSPVTEETQNQNTKFVFSKIQELYQCQVLEHGSISEQNKPQLLVDFWLKSEVVTYAISKGWLKL